MGVTALRETGTEMAADLRFEEIEVGRRASFRHRFSEDDIDRFSELSGDFSPLHSDDAYAATTPYGRRIVHGLLLASLFSRLFGMYLPGRRNLCLSQSFDYAQPAYAGDELEVSGEVQQKHEATRTLTMRLEIRLPPDRVAVRGKALVKVRD